MTESTPAAGIAAALVLFDVGLVTLTQYILLDPILLFFISASVYSSFKFYSYRERYLIQILKLLEVIVINSEKLIWNCAMIFQTFLHYLVGLAFTDRRVHFLCHER
jgi:dolichyl-phosphate-mannose--protein O-mannosyl transferase